MIAALMLLLGGDVTGPETVLSVAQANVALPVSKADVATVRGRISASCVPLSCSLESLEGEPLARLSLASGSDLEAALRLQAGTVVTLRGRFGRPSVRIEGADIVVMTDRADEFIPIEIITAPTLPQGDLD